MTRLDRSGAELLAGVIRSCMFLRNEAFGLSERCFLEGMARETELAEFAKAFPMMDELIIGLERFSGGALLDAGAVAGYFSGSPHALSVSESGTLDDLPEGIFRAIMVFHMLLPVRIADADKMVGTYENGAARISFAGLENLSEAGIEPDGRYPVHYGCIIGPKLDSHLADVMLGIQTGAHYLGKEVQSLDCAKLRRAFRTISLSRSGKKG